MTRIRAAIARAGQLPFGELLMLGRFFIIGILATLMHITVAIIAIRFFGLTVFPANLLAFLSGFSLAFVGHYHFTFRAASHYYRALMRYFIISATAFAVNNLLLWGLVKSGLPGDIVSVIVAAAVIPLISYTASRLWGFR